MLQQAAMLMHQFAHEAAMQRKRTPSNISAAPHQAWYKNEIAQSPPACAVDTAAAADAVNHARQCSHQAPTRKQEAG
jgi:hypothetical protein